MEEENCWERSGRVLFTFSNSITGGGDVTHLKNYSYWNLNRLPMYADC